VGVVELDGALGNAARALLDSSTLIAYHSPPERAHLLAKHLLDRIADDRDRLRGYYSALSASELLVRPARTGDPAFTYMHAFLLTFPNLSLLPVDLSAAMQAATLRATTNIRLPDALIIASGLLSGCEVVISNDAGWKRLFEPRFSRFRWIYLSDYL
jgi:predicted nucleic acid-binding protein